MRSLTAKLTITKKCVRSLEYTALSFSALFLSSASIALDTDGDGLSNIVETNTGTFVSASDTGSDPVVADTDIDDFNDGVEVSLGTDPNSALNSPRETHLEPAYPEVFGRFGFSVAVDADTSGACQIRLGASSGVAQIFTRVGAQWSEQGQLFTGGLATGLFCWSISLSGDSAAIGAPGDATGGVVYIFDRTGSTWPFTSTPLIPGDSASGDSFGYAVDIDGDTLFVGAPFDDDNGSASGSVYVFTRTGGVWSEQAKITAGDGTANDNFGQDLEFSSGSLIVGAPGDSDTASNAGSAYIFTGSGSSWTQQAKLSASAPAADDAFGTAVSISNDSVLIGAPGDAANGAGAGAAYVFTGAGTFWTQQQKLLPGDGTGNDVFGDDVALWGEVAVVSAPFDDGPTDSGSAYVFLRSGITWVQIDKFKPAASAQSDNFGERIAIDNGTVALGAPTRQGATGAAYIVDLDIDKDGLLNAVESGTGIFVSQFDTGTDRLDADSDDDSVIDGDETQIHGTDPNANDTDGDGILDDTEIAIGWNPLSDDIDNDGLTDAEESGLGTNPLLADTDMDGISDGEEIASGTDPLIVDNGTKSVPAMGSMGLLALIFGVLFLGVRAKA